MGLWRVQTTLVGIYRRSMGNQSHLIPCPPGLKSLCIRLLWATRNKDAVTTMMMTMAAAQPPATAATRFLLGPPLTPVGLKCFRCPHT